MRQLLQNICRPAASATLTLRALGLLDGRLVYMSVNVGMIHDGSVMGSHRIWTVAEAKARLSEVLRLSEEVGPQRIDLRRSHVVPEHLWKERAPEHKPLDSWLVETMPRGVNLEIRRERGSERPIPFIVYGNE